MNTDRTTYEKAVRDHLARRRQAVPIVPRDALSPLAEWQNRILGADLIQWNDNIADSLLSERALLGKLHNWHKNPVIFFISTMPGLVASQEIVGDEKGPSSGGYRKTSTRSKSGTKNSSSMSSTDHSSRNPRATLT